MNKTRTIRTIRAIRGKRNNRNTKERKEKKQHGFHSMFGGQVPIHPHLCTYVYKSTPICLSSKLSNQPNTMIERKKRHCFTCVNVYTYIHPLRYVTLHCITLHYCTLHYTTLHSRQIQEKKIPARDPKQCRVRTLKGKVERAK